MTTHLMHCPHCRKWVEIDLPADGGVVPVSRYQAVLRALKGTIAPPDRDHYRTRADYMEAQLAYLAAVRIIKDANREEGR